MLNPPGRADGIGMWGQEMLSWSDAGVPRGDASVRLTDLVLTEGLGADDRVLVVGPHPPRLLEVLAGQVATVDVLVRSWPDAVEIAGRGLGERIGVHCGSWDRFAPGDVRWDAVLVPDGLTRLHGPESDPADWAQVLADMSGLTTPRGSVVVGVTNRLAGTLLWSVDGLAGDPDDAWPVARGVRLAPDSAADVRAWAREAGLPARVLSLYPHARHPTVAVGDGLLADPTDPRLARALTDAFVGDTQLPFQHHDPRAAVELVLRHRLGGDLAPGWYVRVGAHDGAGVPRLYESEVSHGSYFGCALLTEASDGRWTRHVPAGTEPGRRSGPVTRDPALLAREVPRAASLEDELFEACAAHDLTEVRRIARAYAAWVVERSDPGAWTSPWAPDDAETCDVVDGRLAFAHLGNLVETDGRGIEVLDDSWALDWPLPVEVVLIATFMRFADRLVTSGSRHPFPPGESPWGLARSLAAMTGRTLRDRDGERAAALTAAVAALRAPSRAPAVDVARAVDEAHRPFGRADFHGLAAMEEAVAASATEIRSLRGKVEWLLGQVVIENRRRIAMTVRAKKAESRLRLRSRIGRRLASTPAAKGVEAWRESRARRGGRWQPPTDQVFAAEVEEVRGRMHEDMP